MKLAVTLPDDPAERDALCRQAARLHAESACAALEDLRCDEARRTALLHALICRISGESAPEIRGL